MSKLAFLLSLLLGGLSQDLGEILQRGDALLGEAKSAYESARATSARDKYVEAGFTLEEARIKFLVLQEIGSPEQRKTAAERMRAVLQLGKLIRDGHAEAVRPSPEAAPPTAVPAEAPPPPLKPAADPTRRAPAPEGAPLKDAEKQIRDIFKERYARKAPAERRALARALLEQAARSQDDPVAFWALCSEARDAAAQGFDLKSAFEAVDAAARFFDVDVLSLKAGAMALGGRTARLPEEFGALAADAPQLQDEQAAADQFDAAEKTAAQAAQWAKKAGDPALAARAERRAKEMAEAKTLHQAMTKATETLARNPDDAGANAEFGRFLCFVKDSWDLGLRFLRKGSDATLKSLAEKELAAPADSAGMAALADGWASHGEKERSPLRKSRILSRAADLYEAAYEGAPALLRLRIDKRLGELEAILHRPVNLLRLIDPARDATRGAWSFDGRSLLSPDGDGPTLMIPYQPPDEYDLSVTVTRVEGGDAFCVGLVGGSAQFGLILDGHVARGCLSGFEVIDGKYVNQHGDAVQGRRLETNQSATLLCSVRKGSVSATLDGRPLAAWQGNLNRLSPSGLYKVTIPRALFLGTWGTRARISRLLLTPVSGQGKKLR